MLHFSAPAPAGVELSTVLSIFIRQFYAYYCKQYDARSSLYDIVLTIWTQARAALHYYPLIFSSYGTVSGLFLLDKDFFAIEMWLFDFWKIDLSEKST